jgi:hypothetical protein
MLKLATEELSALNLVLQFTTVKDLLTAAMRGYVDDEDEETTKALNKEISDLCWKVLKTLP